MYIFTHKIIECRIIYKCMCVYADADMEDYGFEYSDEEPEEQDVDIENQYYNSKGIFRFDFRDILQWVLILSFLTNMGSQLLLLGFNSIFIFILEQLGFNRISFLFATLDDFFFFLTSKKNSGLVETDPEGALSGFDEVVRMEPEKAEW